MSNDKIFYRSINWINSTAMMRNRRNQDKSPDGKELKLQINRLRMKFTLKELQQGSALEVHVAHYKLEISQIYINIYISHTN